MNSALTSRPVHPVEDYERDFDEAIKDAPVREPKSNPVAVIMVCVVLSLLVAAWWLA